MDSGFEAAEEVPLLSSSRSGFPLHQTGPERAVAAEQRQDGPRGGDFVNEGRQNLKRFPWWPVAQGRAEMFENEGQSRCRDITQLGFVLWPSKVRRPVKTGVGQQACHESSGRWKSRHDGYLGLLQQEVPETLQPLVECG